MSQAKGTGETMSAEDVRGSVLERVCWLELSPRSESSKFGKYFLVGARGFGKSYILRQAAAEEQQEPVEGRDWESALADLKDRQKTAQGGTREEVELSSLYFDDIDYFFGAVRDFAPKRVDEAINLLRDVATAVLGQKRRCVLGSTISQERLQKLLLDLQIQGLATAKVVEAASMLLASFDVKEIRPWEGDWEKRIEDLSKDLLQPIETWAAELVAKTVRDLTCGHPGLLVPCFQHLAGLLDAERRERLGKDSLGGRLAEDEPPTGDAPGETLKDDLRHFLEDALRRQGIGLLTRAVTRLKASGDPEARAAYEGLLELVRSPGPRSLPVKSRDLLRDEGLLFRDPKTSKYLLPGSLFRKDLEFEAGGTFSVRLEPDRLEPDKQGIVVASDGVSHRQARISGGSWSVLQVLFEEAPRFVSLEELQERTHLRTPHAVRSAIQRLTKDLRGTLRVEGLVENRYGKGYRKGDSPSWAEEA